MDSYLILTKASIEFEISSRKKVFFFGVECVDDQAHHQLDVGIEGAGLRHGSRKPGKMMRCDNDKTCTKMVATMSSSGENKTH